MAEKDVITIATGILRIPGAIQVRNNTLLDPLLAESNS